MFAVPCALIAKGTIPEMPQHVAMQLYKIAQEAISNAVKHGKASHVAITLARHDDLLALTIKNDGKPFAQPAEPTKRMGLRIMNYRANLVGASLAIEANRSGTTVTCTLPVKSNRRANSPSFVDEDLDEAEPVAFR
jgi:signal transduction histidine kinase